MSNILADFLRTEAAHFRDQSERQKAAKLDWQRAVHDLVYQMAGWLKSADQDGVLRVQRTDHEIEDYDLGRHLVSGLLVVLGETAVQITPSEYEASGSIQVPGDTTRRAAHGRVTFDNGTDRLSLYRVKDGERDVWLWWSQGGVGKPFDRESFEAAIVSLLR